MAHTSFLKADTMTRFFLVLTFLCALSAPLQARATAAVATDAATTEEAATAEPPAPPIDSIGRSSPRGLVEGFLAAIGNENFEKAAQYLDMGNISDRQRSIKGAKLAQDLQTLLDRGGWFTPSAMLSSAREGKLDGDDPETDITDIIGGIQTDGGAIDMLAKRVTDKDGKEIWVISKETLNQIPTLVTASANTEPVINSVLPDFLLEHKWGGAPAGHWIAVVFLLVMSYSLAWFLMKGFLALIKKVWKKRCNVSGVHILDTLHLPLSLYSAVWIFGLSSFFLDISVLVRQHTSQLNVIVAWLAIAIFLWRLVDVFAETAQRRIGGNARFYGFSSILYFFRRLIKIAFGVIVLFIILDNMGVDVTAGLAALGIGGIALALGAQKTLENFIGSLAIVIDQPVHIGDYCKIGGVAGTVEDIGMRSTRLRTNDRTLVTIPNGDLSNQTIENYARRNRFLINKKFSLRYDTKSAQVRKVVERITQILKTEEAVSEERLPVRFIGFNADGLLMEIFCYVNVADNTEFLRIQEDLMLKILDAVEENGAFFAIPSQTFLSSHQDIPQPPIQHG